MLKDDLLLCGQLDPKAINEMATSYGGMVLRIPPYHCHLNPIEHYWAHLKDQLREQLVPNDKLDAVERWCRALFVPASVHCARYFEHCIGEEERHIAMEEIDLAPPMSIHPVIATAPDEEEQEDEDGDEYIVVEDIFEGEDR